MCSVRAGLMLSGDHGRSVGRSVGRSDERSELGGALPHYQRGNGKGRKKVGGRRGALSLGCGNGRYARCASILCISRTDRHKISLFPGKLLSSLHLLCSI